MAFAPRTVHPTPGTFSFESVTLLYASKQDKTFRMNVDYGNGKVMRNWELNAPSLKEALEEAESFGKQIQRMSSHQFQTFKGKHQRKGTFLRFGIVQKKDGSHGVTIYKPGIHTYDLKYLFKFHPTVEISTDTLQRLKLLARELRGELDGAILERNPEEQVEMQLEEQPQGNQVQENHGEVVLEEAANGRVNHPEVRQEQPQGNQAQENHGEVVREEAVNEEVNHPEVPQEGANQMNNNEGAHPGVNDSEDHLQDLLDQIDEEDTRNANSTRLPSEALGPINNSAQSNERRNRKRQEEEEKRRQDKANLGTNRNNPINVENNPIQNDESQKTANRQSLNLKKGTLIFPKRRRDQDT